MFELDRRIRVSMALLAALAVATCSAFAQETPLFTPGNLVVVVEGCGVYGGTCTSIPNGTGTGAENSSSSGYGDNQAAPLTLFQYAPSGTSSVTYVNSLVFPQAAVNANFPVSGEYGSSSEGTVQLSGPGQYLTVMGYGINAAAFDAAYYPGFTVDPYGAAPSGALAQSGSLTSESYTPVPRVIALIDPYGNINSSTALYNIFDTNNPRSIYTLDGLTGAWVSGQGTGCDLTGGVFYTPLGAPNNAPTAITGGDAVPTSSCVASGYTGSYVAQDTRTVQAYDNTLYISIDSTEGKSDNRALIGTLGTPPATSLFSPTTPPTGDTGGPNLLPGFGNTGGTGRVKLTAAEANGINTSGEYINLSPSNYFFASSTVLYVADTGSPKNSSASSETTYSLCGAGGLQKWVNESGTWTWVYTLYQGLNLVENATCSTNTDGTTGLYGLTGVVSGNNVYLYTTNYTIADLDPTYLYGITDTLSATTSPGTSFTLLDTAPQDSNFKGVSLAPSLPSGSATITTSPSGLAVTTAGSGCVPGTYTTPATLLWTPGSACTLSVVSPQGPTGTQYTLTQWQDGTTDTSDSVVAPSTSAVYSATFSTAYELTTTAGTGGTISPGGYIPAGTETQITATPSSGYYFVNFTGTTTSTTNPLTLEMDAPQSITANFAPMVTPTVTWPSASAITYGQTLASSTLTSGSATYDSTTVPGNFAFTNSSTVPLAGAQTESVTFTPSSSEYSAVTSTVSVQVNQATPTVTWPTASAITYGQTLSSSTFTGGSAVSPITSASVPGGFAFTNSSTVPTASGPQSVTFTPSDNTDYASVTNTVTVQVNPATPTVTWPTASAITYGQTLGSSTLSNGLAIAPYTGATVGGNFAFATPTLVPYAGTQSEIVTFTPSNTSEYSAVSNSVNVLVNMAPTTISVLPTATAIDYGQMLASSSLSGGTAVSTITGANVPGIFTFTSPSTTPAATGLQSVTFTPLDTNDYLGTTASVTVAVTPVPLASVTPSSINFGTLYLGNIVTKTVTIANIGDAAMTISDPLIAILHGGDSSEFVSVNLCPKSLAAGKSCAMTVTFIAGPYYTQQTATLVINDNAAGGPQNVPLTATVIDPVAQFSAPALSFDTVKADSGNASKSISVISAGGTALSISKVSIAGADPEDFYETDNCTSDVLNPKAGCTITVTFQPQAKGLQSATLVVTDNALNSPQLIPLSGTGN